MELLPAQELALINPLCFSNVNSLNDPAFRRWLFWYNTARDVTQPAIEMGRYAPDTLLDGAGPYAILADNVLVEEQSPPEQCDVASSYRRLVSGRASALKVDRPCLMACHNGSRTWGHWLLDMLPKIVMAERSYPQQFTFVIPAPASTLQHFDNAVSESLAAYGIAANRLLHVRPDTIYRFQNLFDIANIVCDGLHPGVVAAMREQVRIPQVQNSPVTAVMRGDVGRRAVINLPEIKETLRRHGAASLDPEQASFSAQVNAFRGSDVIVGDLGSNLTASIYMRPETGIVTMAPSGWYDGYFVNIYQRLRLYHADVRGLSFGKSPELRGHAPHCVNPADLSEALAVLAETPRSALAAPRVAGRIVARAPGELIRKVTFGHAGNAAPFQRGDFAPPEETHTWSLGPSSGLAVPDLGIPAGDCWLEIKGIGFVARPHLVSRQLNVGVNGTLLGEFDIDELTHLYVPLPRAVLRQRHGLDIAFGHPICPSPNAMGLSPDTRNLGFMFEYVAIRRA